MLADRTLAELLAEIAAATPAPGGGSTAAVACALAAALVEMSAGAAARARGGAARAGARAGRPGSASPTRRCSPRSGLPADDPARADRVRAALSAAAQAPLDVAEVACEVAELAAELARGGRPSLEGDAATAALLAEAATRAAVRLVELNLAAAPDDLRLRAAREYAARAWSAREGSL